MNPSTIRQRRSGRIAQELLIQVSGTDVIGKDFNVPTRTLMLSRYGAKILLAHELGPEQEISIYCPWTGNDQDARVVGLFAKESEGHTYGVEFLKGEVNFWNMPFPPAPLSSDWVAQLEEDSQTGAREQVTPAGSDGNLAAILEDVRKASSVKDYAVRLICPRGDHDQWMMLQNREEPLKQILDIRWGFECPVHGLQREFPLQVTETRCAVQPKPPTEESKGSQEASGGLAEQPLTERSQQEPRSVQTLRVWVRGVDRNGNLFLQSAHSIDISRHGGRLDGLGYVTWPGTTIEVRRRWRKALFRVVWTGRRCTPQANQIGISCLEPSKNIWGLPEPEEPQDAVPTLH